MSGLMVTVAVDGRVASVPAQPDPVAALFGGVEVERLQVGPVTVVSDPGACGANPCVTALVAELCGQMVFVRGTALLGATGGTGMSSRAARGLAAHMALLWADRPLMTQLAVAAEVFGGWQCTSATSPAPLQVKGVGQK